MADLEARLRQARPHLEVAWSDDEVARVEAGMKRKRERRRLVRTAVVTVLVVGALGWTIAGRRDTHSGGAPTTVALVDGSHVTLPDAQKLVRRVESRERVVLELTAGRAEFAVFHDKKRPFRVEAGAVAVEVLGTKFAIDRSAQSTAVVVTEGRVAVFSATGRRELTAGQSVSFPLEAGATLGTDHPTSTTAVATTQPPTEPAPTPAVAPPEPVLAAAPTPPTEPSHPTTVHRPRTPHPNATGEADDATVLMDAADHARESGHPADAVVPLRRLIAEHPHDARAPLAAFTLGRILLEHLHRPHEAADAFARAQQPATALHEDALAREVYAASRAGDEARAHARAVAYAERYPTGPHLAAVKRAGKIE